jgi:hypothetical protein
MKKFKSISRAIKRRRIRGYFNSSLNHFFFYRLTTRGKYVGFDPYRQLDTQSELTLHQIESLIKQNK